MKKLFLLALVAMFGLQSQAQIVSSRTSMTKTTVVDEPKNGWSTFGFEYLPSSANPDEGSSKSFTGLALTWTKARSITTQLPLYLEAGLGAQYSFYNESEGKYETNVKVASVKVPLNLIYDYLIPNTNINLDPYLGLRFRVNVFGELEREYNGDSKTYNVFDKDDMGGSDYVWNRFQMGWQIGVKARFNNSFFVGVAYGTDFSEISKKVKISETQLSLGFVF